MSCGVGRRRGSDLALLWLWCRLAATAPIRPLAWEPPYAVETAQEKAKRQKDKKKRWKTHLSNNYNLSCCVTSGVFVRANWHGFRCVVLTINLTNAFLSIPIWKKFTFTWDGQKIPLESWPRAMLTHLPSVIVKCERNLTIWTFCRTSHWSTVWWHCVIWTRNTRNTNNCWRPG